MQPQQPEPAAADVAETEDRSNDASEQPSSSGWHNLFGLLPGKKPTADQAAEGTSADESTGTAAPSTKTLTLTEDELDRRVQAETDRREAKRRKDEVARAEQERLAAIERKLDPNNPAEYDPYAGAEERAALKAAEDANQQFSKLITDVGDAVTNMHDQAVLQQLEAALPTADRERIFRDRLPGPDIEGRKSRVQEALKALEKHWKAEGQRAAEARLREDGIFRKQVFAEHREQVDEPELLPANGGSARTGDRFVNMILDEYDGLKGRRGRRR